jgi:response regulator of citrate/malate metabolism
MKRPNPREYTITDKGWHKITEEAVVDIISTRNQTTHKAAAEKHGISKSHVRHIRHGRRRHDLYAEVIENESLI